MQSFGVNALREKFLSFYEERGHLRLPSFPLVPQSDPSLLLINSGMAPMKPWFTGEQTPPRKRVTTCQKCVRTVDIDNVGKTSRHGTYFEMLGNFSFGDYFKEEAIAWYWEFLTRDVGIDEALLYPSVYEQDDEAFDIWRDKVGIPAERIIRLGKKDNFWEHGAGPCVPCSEVYFDRGESNGCGSPHCAPGCDCDRFIEIGNNVFTQFSNDGNGNYTELSQKNIDFGGGLERLAIVCQGKDNIFDIDTMTDIMDHICRVADVKYKADAAKDISLRIITDHIRSATMLICDGVLPSNEGRGYILRRLLRRAARHGKLLGIAQPFLHEICKTVVAVNEAAYPDLARRTDMIAHVISAEEESFGRTVDAGLRLLRGITDSLKKERRTVLPGADAFKLYDTFGFPVDLTTELLQEQGLSLQIDEFDRLMQEQKTRARQARLAAGNRGWNTADWGKHPETVFLGYDALTAEAKLLALTTDTGPVASAVAGEGVSLILDQTPFYAESGGQSADHGTIVAPGGAIDIDDVQKTPDGKFIHAGVVVEGVVNTGQTVRCQVDAAHRRAIARAHSATHLLQAAIRSVVGGHVEQGGSLVEPDRLRFDFTHFTALTAEQVNEIADLVNQTILEGIPVISETVPLEQAKSRGAMALFGEKYGETVRLVQMGEVSLELCGGTHVSNTAMVGGFQIKSEGSVAAGLRRIEAQVGREIVNLLNHHTRFIRWLCDELKTSPEELKDRFIQRMAAFRNIEKSLRKSQESAFIQEVKEAMAEAQSCGPVKLLMLSRPGMDAKTLQAAGDHLRNAAPDLAALLASDNDGKVTLFASAGKEAVSLGVKAGDMVKTAAAAAGGSGGGKPESAMGGIKDADKIEEAFASVRQLLQSIK